MEPPQHSKPNEYFQGLRPKPAMVLCKKPAARAQKKPAAQDLPLVQFKEQEQEEPEEEEAAEEEADEHSEAKPAEAAEDQEDEEGEEDEEDEAKDSPEKDKDKAGDANKKEKKPKRTLSKQALKDHNLFIKEAKDLSDEDFDHFLKKLDDKQTMCLWKKFQTSRQANPGVEKIFKDATGQVARKRALLRGWVQDGGKPAKFFKQSSVEFRYTHSTGLQASWLSWKETCDKISEDELKARVEAGTIQYRKNPEDRRFFQFKLNRETEDTKTSRRASSRAQAKVDSSLQDFVNFDKLKEAPTVEDFDLDQAL